MFGSQQPQMNNPWQFGGFRFGPSAMGAIGNFQPRSNAISGPLPQPIERKRSQMPNISPEAYDKLRSIFNPDPTTAATTPVASNYGQNMPVAGPGGFQVPASAGAITPGLPTPVASGLRTENYAPPSAEQMALIQKLKGASAGSPLNQTTGAPAGLLGSLSSLFGFGAGGA